MWDVTRVSVDDAGQTQVALRLAADAASRTQWAAEFEASFTVSFGTTLTMTLAVENRDTHDIAYECALHTYLEVGDVEMVRISGLEETRFIDKVDGSREKRSGSEPLTAVGETDRVFLSTTGACVVDDPVSSRRILIDKEGSDATVVWNPGPAKALGISDIGEDWRHFVCVETANCAPHVVRLRPGARHATTATISVTPA